MPVRTCLLVEAVMVVVGFGSCQLVGCGRVVWVWRQQLWWLGLPWQRCCRAVDVAVGGSGSAGCGGCVAWCVWWGTGRWWLLLLGVLVAVVREWWRGLAAARPSVACCLAAGGDVGRLLRGTQL